MTITSCVIALRGPRRDSRDMTESSSLATHRLRLVLRANALFSITGGTVALVAGSWISRELGIDHVALTRMIGAGLIGFALQALLIARASRPRLLTESVLVSLADAAWVAGTVAVLLSGVLTSTGNLVVGLVGLAVADFGTSQLWFRSRAVGSSTDFHTVAV